MNNKHKKQSGFTLIELLITISITSILLNIALPSFSSLLNKSKMSAEINQLRGTLQLTRNVAIKENKKVTICPSDNGIDCSRNWNDGYIAFVDNNGDRLKSEQERLLFSYKNTKPNIVLRWRAFGVRNSFQWHQTGITNHQNGIFEYCHTEQASASRALIISKAGSIRLSKDTNEDEIHENASGDNIIC